MNSIITIDEEFRSLNKNRKTGPKDFHSFTDLGEVLRIFNEEKKVSA